ncbi:MAG: DUF2863 family protein [Casimicrobiaceae bacterium]|nr:DUF2863 family protein [Casimicrobiaceae bacterium]MCX8098535.1 DUF2863 family protein [Casimicrobiaceae bacterium]MDW8311252.1 DUF2863 family protein [Burkholderiales bacterium]
MARAPFRRKSGPRETSQLIRLAEGLAGAKSRTEDAFWERELERAILTLLENGDDEAINRALDRARELPGATYDTLADMVESLAESIRITTEAGAQRIALFCAPLLAWGRTKIPARAMPAQVLRDLSVQIRAHVFADKARIVLCDTLFAPDQLPTSYSQTRELLQSLAACLETGQPLAIDPAGLPEAPDVVCDMRMIVGAVQVDEGAPLYVWQETTAPIEDAMRASLEAWRTQGGAALKPLLVGFPFQMLLPRTFFGACREADLASRPYSISAGVAYLEAMTQVRPDQITAIVGGCWGDGLEEYRIGFSIGDSTEVAHGCVWPLVAGEDDDSQIEAIDQALKSARVGNIIVLSDRLPLEFCDDCGSPYYPNRDGELVHAALPEAADGVSVHLH